MLVFPAVEALSMMGGRGNSGGPMMDSGSSGGHMMDDGSYSKGGWRRGNPRYDGKQRPYEKERSQHRANPGSGMLGKGEARDLADQHMKSHYREPYRMGPITDKKSYYQTEVTRPDGSFMERLLIDKGTGRIHSIR
jgi:hypothetical protein